MWLWASDRACGHLPAVSGLVNPGQITGQIGLGCTRGKTPVLSVVLFTPNYTRIRSSAEAQIGADSGNLVCAVVIWR